MEESNVSEELDDIIRIFSERLATAGGINNKVKFSLDEGSTILMDSTGVRLAENSVAADVILHTRVKTLTGIFDGSINPALAFIAGKIRVEGDTGIAKSLKGILL